MSLLSSLRYPISMPPTRAQLEALPHDVYTQWLTEMRCEYSGKNFPEPFLIAEVLHKCDQDSVRPMVERLQCIVYGLDE